RYKTIKRGARVEDIYLSITIGVDGTPMPSFNETLSENDRWNLTSYVLSVMGKERR
ncbi:MAG: cytochrome C, partial [Nitrospirae bacterium]|nr:cytochrome C [Nitrospirota bacterium]